jgi:hypothetical protein
VTTLSQVRDAMATAKSAPPAIKEQLTMVMALALAGEIEGADLERSLHELVEVVNTGDREWTAKA